MIDPSPFGLLLRWLVPLWLLGWVMLPLSRRLFVNLPDGGLAAGRIITIFLASLFAFWTAALHIIPLTVAPLWFLVLPLAAVWAAWRHKDKRAEMLDWIRAQRGALAVSDAIFLCSYALFLWIRLRNPTIFDLEKPMDAALMASAARAVWLPFENPWLSGVPFTNYYYFGPLMAGNLARTFATPVAFAYNLVQPLFCALFLSALWAVCAAVTRSLWRGFVALSVVGLMGHFEPLRQMYELQQWSLNPTLLSWWSTSRVVPDTNRLTGAIARSPEGNPIYTINEYPVFTLAIGDAHAHFYALSFAGLLFCLCWALFARPQAVATLDQSTLIADKPSSAVHAGKSSRKKRAAKTAAAQAEASKADVVIEPALQSTSLASSASPARLRHLQLLLLGTLLGGFVITNTWDAPLYTLLVLACAFFTRDKTHSLFKELLWCLVPLVVAPLVAIPYLLRFKSQVKGVAFEWWTPNAASFFLYWGGWLSLALVAWVTYCFTQHEEEERTPSFLIAMSALGLVAMLAPFVFYIRGYFEDGDYRHQDTVFKFYSQGWLLLGTGASCGALWLLARTKPLWRTFWGSVWAVCWVVPFLCGASVVLWRGNNFAAREADGSVPLSLDGSIPSSVRDYTAMDWLRQNAKPGEAVLEATKRDEYISSYTEYGRVAALTGVPTPLGWSQHVWYWGANIEEDIKPRRALIEQVYHWPDDISARTALEELKNMNVRYIFVGDLERRTYPPGALDRIRQTLPLVFDLDQTFIAKVR